VNKSKSVLHYIDVEKKFGFGETRRFIVSCPCGFEVVRGDQGRAEEAGLIHLQLQAANEGDEYVGKH
jgi:hypothetical protein